MIMGDENMNISPPHDYTYHLSDPVPQVIGMKIVPPCAILKQFVYDLSLIKLVLTSCDWHQRYCYVGMSLRKIYDLYYYFVIDGRHLRW